MIPSRLEEIERRLAATEHPLLDEAILYDPGAMDSYAKCVSSMIRANELLAVNAAYDERYLLRIVKAAVKMMKPYDASDWDSVIDPDAYREFRAALKGEP